MLRIVSIFNILLIFDLIFDEAVSYLNSNAFHW